MLESSNPKLNWQPLPTHSHSKPMAARHCLPITKLLRRNSPSENIRYEYYPLPVTDQKRPHILYSKCVSWETQLLTITYILTQLHCSTSWVECEWSLHQTPFFLSPKMSLEVYEKYDINPNDIDRALIHPWCWKRSLNDPLSVFDSLM